MKTVDVEGLSESERTSRLLKGLTQYGYKIQIDNFIRLLQSRGLTSVVAGLKEHKMASIGAYEKPVMISYSVCKINGECAFYVSQMRTDPVADPEKFPEKRFIIQSIGEFNAWLFSKEVRQSFFRKIAVNVSIFACGNRKKNGALYTRNE